MFAQERQEKIIEALKERSRLLLPELEEILQVSPATVRRDLSYLESLRKVVRTHGGVLLPTTADEEASLGRKSRREHNARVLIAKEATALVREGQSVFVDAGRTALEVGRRLLQQRGLTIFTNSIPLMNEQPAPACRLVAIGGEVHLPSRAVVGATAMDWMRRLSFDLAFVGASGIDAAKGPCTADLSEAGLKAAAIQAARRAVLLVDASKWREPAPIRFAEWCEIDDIFTDHEASATEAGILATNGVTLHRAGA